MFPRYVIRGANLVLSLNTTVRGSVTDTVSMLANTEGPCGAYFFHSSSAVNFTSWAVKGLPSCHVIPSRSLNV